jgi:dTDP-D-glucose 4,6-dehydratase
MPIRMVRWNNCYGPNQTPDKIIPRFVKCLFDDKRIRIRGRGDRTLALLDVADLIAAIECVVDRGVDGDTYWVGGDCDMEYSVYDIACVLIWMIKNTTSYEEWIEYIEDRQHHHLVMGFDTKIKALGWRPRIGFADGLLSMLRTNSKNS